MAQKTLACDLTRWPGNGAQDVSSCLSFSVLTLTLDSHLNSLNLGFSYAGKQILPSFISITEMFTHPFMPFIHPVSKHLLNTSSTAGAWWPQGTPADMVSALGAHILVECDRKDSHCALTACVGRCWPCCPSSIIVLKSHSVLPGQVSPSPFYQWGHGA